MYEVSDIVMRVGSDSYYEIMSISDGKLELMKLNTVLSSPVIIDENEISAHWGRVD